MRTLAIILLVITLLVGGFFGYCIWGAQMQIETITTLVTPALEALGTYNGVREQLADGSFLGTKYYDTEFLIPDNYQFLTLTLRMHNAGLFPMDWITIEVVPNAADAAQLAAERTPSLGAQSRGEFATTILTRTGADTNRKITVHYYVLGRKMSVTYDMRTGQ